MKKYNVYGDWGGRYILSTDDEKEAWAALDQLRFDEGYEVRDEYGNIREEFIPF
jgi:hypothetical protein